MKRKMSLDTICKCGHTKKKHLLQLEAGSVCFECIMRVNSKYSEYVHEFKMDNLKWIEQQYDKQTSK